jgi:hypothetical protein
MDTSFPASRIPLQYMNVLNDPNPTKDGTPAALPLSSSPPCNPPPPSSSSAPSPPS